MDGLNELQTKILEIGAGVEETRALAARGLPKAEAEERFKTLAADLVTLNKAAQEEQRKTNERIDEQEAIIARMKLEGTPGGVQADKEARYKRSISRIAADLDVRVEVTATQEEHRKAFFAYLRNGANDPVAREFAAKPEIAAIQRRALSEGVLPEGGYLVEPEIEAGIIKAAVDMSAFMQVARVADISTNEWKKKKRTGTPTAYWVGESGEPTNANALYGEVRIPVHMAGVKTVVSLPMLQDVPYIETEVTADAAQEISRLLNAAFVTGTGIGQPEGFTANAAIIAAYVAGVDASANVVAWEDFANLLYGKSTNKGLKADYRQGAVYAANSDTIAAIFNLADSNGNPIIRMNVGPNGFWQQQIGMKPFVTFEDMDSQGDTKHPLACGDFAQGYRVVRRSGLFVIRDPFTAKPDVELTWYVRYGGGVILSEAIKLLLL